MIQQRKSGRIRRITADWDFKSPFKIAFYIYRICKLGFNELVIKPSSHKGYHVFVWTNRKGKRNLLRAYIGDDTRRIYLDSKRLIGKQTLFSSKKGLRLVNHKGKLIFK